MNYRIILIPIVALWISCAQRSGNRETVNKEKTMVQNAANEIIIDSNVYDDINLFKLEGLKKIEHPTNYPYIVVESLDSFEKRIVYKRTSKDSFERIYQKKGVYWTTSYEFKSDTGYVRIYEYVAPDRIIELDYGGTKEKTDYHLHDVSLIQKDKVITYGFWGNKGINISPHPNNLEIVKKKAKAIFTKKIHKKNDILIIISSSFDKAENKVFYSDTTCYKVDNHSWFWWQYFALGNRIKCE